MATLSNPALSIKLIAGSSNANVVATVNVALSPLEIFLLGNGLSLQLKSKLVGDDDGFTGKDDDLFFFPTQKVTNGGTFTFQATVSRGTLDEDYGNDEVFANFTLQSTEAVFPLVKSIKSNVISGNF
ncbi:hypothetical protein NIES4074_29010 [Cylindrospermum sp. NIES-4074]|nr:hypothetical protein NIES4074_29010 [Cylindrospermum sp. NIES-4074]